jgi:simple sugar transport system ATP-binding protein
MVGRAVAAPIAKPHAVGDVVCALERVTIPGAPRVVDATLALRSGEITAIAGVSGNGQQALADALFGLAAAEAGRIAVRGRTIAANPRAWVNADVARIPEDRNAVGAIGDLPIWENAIAERYAGAFARAGVIRRRAARAYATRISERFDVRSGGGVDAPARTLSGGNLQKLLLGRALTGASGATPALIVATQPTWGLDVGAVAFVHQQLLDACARGAAVLLISEDLDEIDALADRIAVIHAGRLTDARPAREWSRASLGLAMGGS